METILSIQDLFRFSRSSRAIVYELVPLSICRKKEKKGNISIIGGQLEAGKDGM